MLTIGTLVVFGRPKGKKRDGIITKINEKSYIVKTDDNHKGYRVSKNLVKEKTPEPVKPRFENEYVAKLYEDAQGLSKDELIQSLIALQLRVDGLDKKNDELEEKLTHMTDEEAKRCEFYWEEEKQRMLDEVATLQSEVEDKDNEIEKLEEEIEALKDEVNDRVVIEDIANLFDKGEEADDFDWEDEINDMIIENNELKDHLKLLERWIGSKDQEGWTDPTKEFIDKHCEIFKNNLNERYYEMYKEAEW